MDPDANWSEAVHLAFDLQSGRAHHRADVERLAELVLALDEWVKRGGFAPAVFNQKK